MKWRVGIDTGGTFTDIVAVAGPELRVAKVSSTPPQFERGVLGAIAAVGIDPADIEFLGHGTTATTNAVITKTGARTGLITTRGFRDVLELRRHNRAEIYDVLWDPPEPLVPRRMRLEVTERLNYAGEVVVPLDEEDVRSCLDLLRAQGIDSLAVCLLHSYVNPVHEVRIREIVEQEWPELYISVSSDLLREPQEFERTATTVVNSYVGPILAGYVARLRDGLNDAGFTGSLMIMHSGGGLLPADSVIAVPARTLTSGPSAGAMAAEGFAVPGSDQHPTQSGAPAAGALAAEEFARRAGVMDIISVDIGGTSADIGVVRDGRTRLIHEYTPEFGLPIRFPAVDLSTIGAGGGSIAWVDAAGAARSGPQSAGARPGPACYDRGGTQATVTDACLVLGRLSPETRLGGDFTMNLELASTAVREFGSEIGLSVTEAALGILDITNSNMARAIRVMTVERGLDPRQFVLLPFGGAGPMLACELAETLGITSIMVPRAPGVLSAMGILGVDIVHDVAQAAIQAMDEADADALETTFQALEERGIELLRSDGVDEADRILERSLDMRYVGQVKTLNVVAGSPVTEDSLAKSRAFFLTEYERYYHYVTEEIPVELSTVRVRARGVQAGLELPPVPDGASGAPMGGRTIEFRRGSYEAPVYRREDLGVDADPIQGPVIVEQADSTLIVSPGWSLSMNRAGTITLERARFGYEQAEGD